MGRQARSKPGSAGKSENARPRRPEKQIRRPVRASRVIEFLELLTTPSGEGAGGPFLQRKFQRRFTRDIYEPHNLDGKRSVRRAVLSVARKNGKTAYIAGLVLAHLLGPEAIQNGEIYSAANDREQAAVVFKVAAQMVRADPELSAMCKVVDSTKTIACYGNGSFYRAISAEAGTKHGLNPSVVIYDELAQARNRDLFDVLDTSMSARAEPLFIIISTQSSDPEHVLSKLIDDGMTANDPSILVHLYAVPNDCPDVFNPKVWHLANPALGDFRSLDELTKYGEKAHRQPSYEPTFRNLYLNQRFSASTPLISRADWLACKNPELTFERGERVYLALDLASTNDLAALVMLSAENGDRVKSWFWKPETYLEEHARRDFGSGHRRYHEWVDAGWLSATPGRSIDPAFIARKVAELNGEYDIIGLAYDRWRVADFLRCLDGEGIAAFKDETGTEYAQGIRVVAWGQGFKDFAPSVDAFERSVIERRLQHDGSPVLTWNVANAVVVTDPAGNRKLDKDKAKFRIDGAVALAMAEGLKARDMANGPQTLSADCLVMI